MPVQPTSSGIHAHVIHANQRTPLSPGDGAAAPAVVPAAYILIELAGDSLPAQVELDGRFLPLVTDSTRTRGYIQFDAFRSVGFHRLRAGASIFVFCTADTKFGLEGILKILDYVAHEGLSWGFQLLFSDGVSLRHAKIDFAWLMEAAPAILRLASQVSERPYERISLQSRVCRPTSGRVDVSQTIRLLRRNPTNLLQVYQHGPIVASGKRFAPRLVVARKAQLSSDTIGNRRLTWLLRECAGMAASLIENVPYARRQEVRDLRASFLAALGQLPFAKFVSLTPRLPDIPSPEEICDERYIKAFEFWDHLSNGLGWRPGVKVADRFAYVAYADEIFQAFVALTLARAFGAKITQRSLVSCLEGPMFKSNEYEIYYDAVPPKRYFPNWRDLSTRPSAMKPDLAIVHLPTRRGILLDAKYRIEAGGQAPTSGLNECQVYMHSFGRKVIGMCYPGKELRLTEVSGDGNTILEIPISPQDGLQEYLIAAVFPRIEGLMEPLPN